MAICQIALGGNVGDVVSTMDRGLDLLDGSDGISVITLSHVYRTEPVGPCSGEAFLNAAATLECTLDPFSLLRVLKAVEASVGRESGTRWSPRPLDLDLLLLGDTIVQGPPLKVPHPHLWYRRFVLDPLVDIAPSAVHPLLEDTIGDLQSRLLRRPLPISLRNLDAEDRSTLHQLLTAQSPDIVIVDEGDESNELTLDFGNSPRDQEVSPGVRRCVRVNDLPDSPENAALSVLTAALDQPVPHSRPLRRMP